MRYTLPALASLVLLLLALGMVMVTVERQTLRLVADERARVEAMYVASRERELQHYVMLARAAMERIAADGGAVAPRQQQALAVLARMRFGDDGYFFVYDRQGQVLLDPEQMDTQGVAFCEPDDPAGRQQADIILATAAQGGGMVRYAWMRPASMHAVPKMSYVTRVEPWGWTLGAGLYLDEVQARLQDLDERGRDSIAQTRNRIAGIAAFAIGLAGLGWLSTALWQQRQGRRRVHQLVQRLGQAREGERERLGRELHDGVVQVVVSSRHLIEAAQRNLADAPAASTGGARHVEPQALLQTSLLRLDEALAEIRRVSHGMLPAQLDTGDLPGALAALVAQWQEAFPFDLHLQLDSPPRALPAEHRVALLRIAQEAVVNVCRHAGARNVVVELSSADDQVRLAIQDDGTGFAVAQVQGGVGLGNMRERAQRLGGRLRVRSDAGGTLVEAILPLPGGEDPA